MTTANPSIPVDAIYSCDWGEAPKLTANNYHQWSQAMKPLLQAAEVLELTLGNENFPAGKAAKLDFYRRRTKAATMILLSLSDSIRIIHIPEEILDPYEMWTTLEMYVKTSFGSIRLDSYGLTSYITELRCCRPEGMSEEELMTHAFSRVQKMFNEVFGKMLRQPEEKEAAQQLINTLLEASIRISSREFDRMLAGPRAE